MATKKERDTERAEALAHLRKLCPKGTRIYTILRHVSKSGMCRRVSLYVIRGGIPVYLTGYISRVTQFRMHHSYHDSIVVHGCGTDVGFEVVHTLSYVLHGMPADPRWKRVEARKAALLASAKTADARYAVERKFRDNRAGYTLKQEWL